MESRTCRECGHTYEGAEIGDHFGACRSQSGKLYAQHVCKPCRNRRDREAKNLKRALAKHKQTDAGAYLAVENTDYPQGDIVGFCSCGAPIRRVPAHLVELCQWCCSRCAAPTPPKTHVDLPFDKPIAPPSEHFNRKLQKVERS